MFLELILDSKKFRFPWCLWVENLRMDKLGYIEDA